MKRTHLLWLLLAAFILATSAYAVDYAGTTTGAELDYVHGVTSAIQTQLNNKQASGDYATNTNLALKLNKSVFDAYTSGTSSATYTNVVSLWNTCDNGYLKFDGTCSTPSSHNAVTIGTGNGLSLSTQVLSLSAATNAAAGAATAAQITELERVGAAIGSPSDGVNGVSFDENTATFSPSGSKNAGLTIINHQPNAYYSGTNHRMALYSEISGGSMVYPGAGVPVSTGSAWGTSLNIASVSGNATKVVTTTGTLTNGNCVQIDAAGNFVAASGPCTTGGSMTWPTTAGIPYWTSGTAWGGAYNATTKIPANYITDPLNQNTTGTSGGLTGTPNIAVGTGSATSITITGTAGAGFIAMPSQSSNPSAPAAGSALVHAKTTNGFTRVEIDNEATTNTVINRDNVFLVNNNSGGSITKGQVVYINGVTGGVPTVAKARANSASTVGSVCIMVDTVADTAYNQCMTRGILTGFDTSAFSANDTVYISTATAGSMQSTRPSGTSAAYVQKIGKVLTQNASTGSAFIEIAPFVGNIETGTTAAAFGVTTIELGHASDTTLARSGAGVMTVEGVTVTRTIAAGTSVLGTSAISSGACATVVTTTATNTATTDVINWGFNGDPTGVTGYAPSASGMLTIIAYPSANNVNYKVCNNTASSVTPGAITLNWQVTR